MSAQNKKESIINLLPQEEFAASTVGRVLKWLLSTFRIIVISTEMVVMIAFLSRFWLDAQVSDLNQSIQQKTAVISSYENFERDFRRTQNKLKILSAFVDDKFLTTPIIKMIAQNTPEEIRLIDFTLAANTLNIRGVSLLESSVSQYITNIKSLPNVESVKLNGIETKEGDASVNFTLKITMKEGGVNGKQ